MRKCLTWNDRLKIEAWLQVKMTPIQIARKLGKNYTTIYKELKRGRYTHLNSDYTTEERYSPDIAERKYQEGLRCRGPQLKIGSDYKLAEYIEYMIKEEGYSPGAVLGEIKRNKTLHFDTTISKTTLYRYIDEEIFLTLTNADLPVKSKKKKQSHHRPKTQKRVSRGESIERRPPEVAERKEFGHWEMDCVVGKKKSSKKTLLVLTERVTRQEIIRLMPDHTCESVRAALNKIERSLGAAKFSKIFQTITVDNGSEFSDTIALEQGYKVTTRTKVFYCHPYSSWERGSNENANKLIRRHLPKGTSFGKLTAAKVQKIEDWINHYPREILDWYSSSYLFNLYMDTIFCSA